MIFRRDPLLDTAARLYGEAVAQARQPAFYEEGGVPDTVDGRFEMLALHVFLLMRRLKAHGEAAKALSQRLVEALIADLDANLREMGAGDLGVAPRVKRMAKGFYGRAGAYEEGLDGPPGALEAAVRRNIYGTVEPAAGAAERMAAYARSAEAALAKQPPAGLLKGDVSFSDAVW
jgi:cytochrome b pre-mRNA-processing protein 3